MNGAAYLHAVRSELGKGDIRPDLGDSIGAHACTWRWGPGHRAVNTEVWHGCGVEIRWTRAGGWTEASIRPDGAVTGRQRLELATWANPEWAASAVWALLTGDVTDAFGRVSRRVWDELPGCGTPADVPYIGGPFDGRTVRWERTRPAELGLIAGTHGGKVWPSGCYVLDCDHGGDRPRFLWLGPVAEAAWPAVPAALDGGTAARRALEIGAGPEVPA